MQLPATTIQEVQKSLETVLSFAVAAGKCDAELAQLVASQWYEIDGSLMLPETIMDAQDVLVALIIHFGGTIEATTPTAYIVQWPNQMQWAHTMYGLNYLRDLEAFVAGVR